jgi:UDP-N-acetylmuramoyl-tripeptide--D-alanyl-D-alanine ligase
MRAALEALTTVGRSHTGRTFAVLGYMAELGPAERSEHEALGRLAAGLSVARVIAVGEAARPIERAAALEGSWHGEASWVPDAEAAVRALRNELRAGDVVLVKASRAASLERVAMAIAEDRPDGSTEGGEAWASRPS